MVGKTEPTLVYELLGRRGELAAARLKAVRLYEQALQVHWDRKWAEADGLLGEALILSPGDSPSLALRERLKFYAEHPPPDGWQGEHVMTTK